MATFAEPLKAMVPLRMLRVGAKSAPDLDLQRMIPMNDPSRIRTFADFYPFYLSEHSNRVSRRLHFAGTSIALALLIAALVTQAWWLIVAALVQGYAFAWVGHFFFEHNRPATFKYPGFSFVGDWRMWWDILTRKIPF
jgi:hypothetical protein